MQFIIDGNYNLSTLSMCDLTETQFDMLRCALREVFGLMVPKPEWEKSVFEDKFTMTFWPRPADDQRQHEYQESVLDE